MSGMKARVKTIGLWALTLLLVLMFFMVGLDKFTSHGWMERFANWGYPDNFLYVIGVLEMLGAVGLLIPRLAGYAAGGLIVIMIGATITHLVHGEFPGSVIHLVLLSIVLYARRPAFLRKQAPQPDAAPDAALDPSL